MKETWDPGHGEDGHVAPQGPGTVTHLPPCKAESCPEGPPAPYLLCCCPNRLALLRPDDLLDLLVPGVAAAAEADGGSEEVAAVLLHLGGLGVEAPGALPGFGRQPLAHGLDALPALGLTKHHHGVVLHVVEALHSQGGDVQQGVLVLGQGTSTQPTGGSAGGRGLPEGSPCLALAHPAPGDVGKIPQALTFSAICRTESNLMTLDDVPSRGTLAAGQGDGRESSWGSCDTPCSPSRGLAMGL